LPLFDYKEQSSDVFGKILRPLVELEIYSEIEKDWIRVRDVLADSGADISVIPRNTGELILTDITKGRIHEVKGVVPFAKLAVYIHNLKFKINSKTFELPVAVADSNDVIPILGRVKGLDLFNVNFDNGRNVSLEE
jgi:hypothetical protein